MVKKKNIRGLACNYFPLNSSERFFSLGELVRLNKVSDKTTSYRRLEFHRSSLSLSASCFQGVTFLPQSNFLSRVLFVFCFTVI